MILSGTVLAVAALIVVPPARAQSFDWADGVPVY